MSCVNRRGAYSIWGLGSYLAFDVFGLILVVVDFVAELELFNKAFLGVLIQT